MVGGITGGDGRPRNAGRVCSLTLFIVWVVGSAGLASAQRAWVLAPDAPSAAHVQAAHGALAAAGFTPVEAPSELDEAGVAQATLAAAMREAGTELAVRVAWAGPGPVTTVRVLLVTPEAASYPGTASCADRALPACVGDALSDARALSWLGPGPWLHVRGDPEGAEVWLDGVRVGTAPYRGPVRAGRHRVELRARGHLGHAYRVDVPDAPEVAVTLPFQLPVMSLAGLPPAVEAPAEARRAGPLLGPLLLGIAGIGAATFALVVGAGCDDARCGGLGRPARIGMVAGGAGALAGGLLWFELGGADDGPREATP